MWPRNTQASAKNLAMRSHWNWVTWHQTPAYWCVTTVFKPHWVLVLHHSVPHSHPHSFFFSSPYAKIHESLASGVTEGWIKVLLLPLHRLKSPQFSWISLNEGIIHPRSYTTELRKVKLMAEIFNFVLEKCSLQYVQMCFIFLLRSPPHVSHSGGEANGEIYSPFIPHFMCSFWIYWHNLIMGPSQNSINGR